MLPTFTSQSPKLTSFTVPVKLDDMGEVYHLNVNYAWLPELQQIATRGIETTYDGFLIAKVPYGSFDEDVERNRMNLALKTFVKLLNTYPTFLPSNGDQVRFSANLIKIYNAPRMFDSSS